MKASPALVAVTVGLSSFVSAARAAPVTFTLDPAQSTLTLSGTIAGQPFSEQTPGSLTTGYAGTFDVEVQGGGITLNGRGLHAVTLPEPQRPGRGVRDPGPAVYGFVADTGTSDPIYGAVGGLFLYASSDFRPPIPLNGDTFNPGDVGMFFSDGALFFAQGGAAGTEVDLHGIGSPNSAAGVGTLVTDGNVQTLTLPVRLAGARDVPEPGGTSLVLTGQLVAHAVVPEPSGALLVVCGGCLIRRRRGTR